ncbi:elongation factor P hydroxylase [bacterium]|nr:elongation factor P hydroxylase [bacterium]
MLSLVSSIFDQEFGHSFNVRLLGGADEPVYLPADAVYSYNRLFYRQDYLSSALHEIAHWCIAGQARLQLEDFGYWYHPDGRSSQQQKSFEKAEVKPQALEWMFSLACGHRFSLSTDNLNNHSYAGQVAGNEFAEAVVDQVKTWCDGSRLPIRAAQFLSRLAISSDGATATDPLHYQLTNIV